MKKDIFSVWIKEFGSLVFTQSVQAFLLSIVMSIVLTTAEGGSTSTAGVDVSATGVIAIVALVSISKIELLVKKIFGIESQFGDPSMKAGAAGLAGTLIGARLAGRVLNNAGKLAGGTHDMLGARKAKAKAERNFANGLNNLKTNAADEGAGAGTGAGALGGANQNNLADSLTNGAVAGTAAGNAVGNSMQNGTLNLNPSNLNINAGNVKLDGKNVSDDKKEELREKYEDAIEQAKAQRRQGLYKIASGVAETGGAITGGTAGAIVGLAAGDGALKNAGVGMGIGDYIGEKAVSTVQTVHNMKVEIDDNKKAENKAVVATSNLTGKDISSYRNVVKELEKYTAKLDEINKASSKIDAGNA